MLVTAVLAAITACIVLPYAQKTASAHLDAGPFLGALYVAGAVVAAVLAARRRTWWCVVGVCLGSALRLSTLDCLVCLHSG
ncbi:MAG: hypothetical protein H6723_19605 [Sandaracinus sp.]|nr:hypothetical protein [Sandaracinus sp.]